MNRAKKLKKLKEGGKSVTFLTFDSSHGNVDKILTFIPNNLMLCLEAKASPNHVSYAM